MQMELGLFIRGQKHNQMQFFYPIQEDIKIQEKYSYEYIKTNKHY